MSANELRFWLGSILIAMVAGFCFVLEDAEARYRPVVATQDESAISCGATPEIRSWGLDHARRFSATRIRVNAVENMNPIFHCDPVAAIRAIHAAGFEPYVTVIGSPRYARRLARTVGPLVRYWGIWNEPNISGWQIGYMENSTGPASYRKLVLRVGRALRRNDRDAKLLIGELAPHKDRWFIASTAPKGKKGLRVDGIAVHAYTWYGDPESKSLTGMRGYLTAWRKATKRWAREKRLCLPGKGCRRVPIYVTEAGYLRQPRGRNNPVFNTSTTAYKLVRSWRVACRLKVRQMFHYQLIDNSQPEWDSALFTVWGPRPEFEVLVGYLRSARGCKGRAGALGREFGPPVKTVVPVRHVPIIGPPVVSGSVVAPPDALPLPPDVPPLPPTDPIPDDVPVVVELEPDPPRVEPRPDPITLPGPPEPVVELTPEPPVEPPAEPPVEPVPVDPPIEEPTP